MSDTDDQLEQKNKELDGSKQTSVNEIKILENRLKEYEIYMNEKEEMEKDRSKLREQLEIEKTEKIR